MESEDERETEDVVVTQIVYISKSMRARGRESICMTLLRGYVYHLHLLLLL